MRLLFVLDHPGLLLHFDEAVRELGRRGHTVRLAFGRPGKFGAALDAVATAPGVEVDPAPVPRRSDAYTAVAAQIRASTDVVHYLNPGLEGARFSRKRVFRSPAAPRTLRRLEHRGPLPPRAHEALRRVVTRLEDVLPADPAAVDYVRAAGADAVLVSPLVQRPMYQVDYVKAGRELGLPTAVCVGSWDNLTTRSSLRVVPDVVTVWNDLQRREAVALHGVPPERIVVTGAQQFDRWFGRTPSSTPEAFRAGLGLPADRPFLLFAGSSRWLEHPDAEEAFVRDWLAALRRASDPALRDVAVVVRPHPTTAPEWEGVDLSEHGPAVVWARDMPLPVHDSERAAYYDAIHHAAAVVGINSSAMIEAAIVGRPVHTVTLPEWRPMQHDRIHFTYMLPENGGFLRVARSLPEHTELLAGDLRSDAGWRPAQERFVETALRPYGRDEPALPRLLDAIEGLGRRAPAINGARPAADRALRPALLVASRARQRRLSREKRRRKEAAAVPRSPGAPPPAPR